MTREEFVKATLALDAAFEWPMSPERLELLHMALEHFRVEHVAAAVNRAILTHESTTHPPIALLLRYADEAANGVEMTAEQSISLVWDAVRRHGASDVSCIRAAMDDLGPKLMAAVDAAGGYRRFCDCGSGDKGTLAAQFREAWNGAVRREEQSRRLPAALVPRLNGPEHHLAIGTPATPRLVAQGVNP